MSTFPSTPSSPATTVRADGVDRDTAVGVAAGSIAWARIRRRVLVAVAILAMLTVLLPAVTSWAMGTFAAHDHGRLDVVIDGVLLELDQPRYHDLHPQFHVHAGHGNLWHHHPAHPFAIRGFEPMTLGEAMVAMDLPATASSVAVEGVTYDDRDAGTDVTVTVDGMPFDPAEQVRDDLAILVEVTTSG